MRSESIDRIVAEHARAAGALPGARAPSIARVRREALERFADEGFPTPRQEDWKYTNVAPLERRAFTVFAADADAVSAAQLEALGIAGLAAHRLVFVNGQYSPSLSSVGRLPSGVTLVTLGEALDRNPEALASALAADEHHTVFSALNAAFTRDGVYLHLARDAFVDKPVHLLFVGSATGRAIHPRNVVVAEAGARATLIEHYVGLGGAAYFTNAVTQVFAADHAAIEHYKLQQEAIDAFHVGGLHALQGRASRLLSHSVALGAALARNDITTSFQAQGCEADLDGLYLVAGRQHVDHHTRIDHAQPHGTSREHYRGVLDGSARGVFNGKVVVHPGAQRTDARQTNHNLLLSNAAEVDSKPQLEIYADDVKCTHGATVGQLDEAQLFYLRSRGVDEAVARSLLTHAFAHDVIERIRVGALRSRLEQLLFARLPQGDLIRELA